MPVEARTLRATRSTSIWMVGTALYQVGAVVGTSSGAAAASAAGARLGCVGLGPRHAKNWEASNRGRQSTGAPASAVTSTLTISPCRWKRGITLRARAVRSSRRVERTQRAPIPMEAWVRGTTFGRRVVPLVCITSAIASRPGRRPEAAIDPEAVLAEARAARSTAAVVAHVKVKAPHRRESGCSTSSCSPSCSTATLAAAE